MKKHFTDRSRTEAYQRCPRLRYWNYHFGGRGIEPTRRSLALVVGGCVHEGLAIALQEGQRFMYRNADATTRGDLVKEWRFIEDTAAAMGVGTFDSFLLDSKLELDAREQAELQVEVRQATETTVDFSAEFGLSEDQARKLTQPNTSALEQEKYLEKEQRGLVEALIRSYCRRRLLPLLDEFEVLEVEREGEWLLSEWTQTYEYPDTDTDHCELWWMSRPDALLRHRQTNELQIMSFKTTGAWDVRKERDALRDMQGLSEGVEVERRLLDWWQLSREAPAKEAIPIVTAQGCRFEMFNWLAGLAAPPRISAIRYEYLLKGERWKDKSLSEKLGIECRSQNTPLLMPYKKLGIAVGDDEWAWKYEWEDADGKSRRLDYRSWKKQPVWEAMSVKEWIDILDSGTVQPAAGDALATVFVAPMTVVRIEDDLRDWIEQTEAQEVEVVKDAERVAEAQDEQERRHLLNVLFPMTRRACEYPGTCNYVTLCYGAAELRVDPVGSGRFRERTPNHPVEGLVQIDQAH